jgi:hypothetical protein
MGWIDRALNVRKQIAICDAKSHFSSKGKAMMFADRRGFRDSRPYRCPICDEWHLTTQLPTGSGVVGPNKGDMPC